MNGILAMTKGLLVPTSGNRNRSPRITVFTSPSCPWCKVAKRYITDKGLQFKEMDVIANPKARQEMVRITRQSAVPVIRVGDDTMVGWDERAFEKLLRTASEER